MEHQNTSQISFNQRSKKTNTSYKIQDHLFHKQKHGESNQIKYRSAMVLLIFTFQ